MKTTTILLVAIAFLAAIGALMATRTLAAGQLPSLQSAEYATLRWSGREFTHVVRPDGEVEFLGALFTNVKRVERGDERAQLLTVALNALAKEGWEFAGQVDGGVLLKRPASK